MRRGSKAGRRGPRGGRREIAVRLSRHEREALNVARGLGLWVLFEGPPADRVWVVYDLPSGRTVGTYSPATRRYRFAGQAGEARDWRDALAVAASRGRRTGRRERRERRER